MTYARIGTMADLDFASRLIAEVEGCEVAVFRLGDELYAYENRCPHMAGPVGQGKLARKVEAREQADDSLVEEFSKDDVEIVCPWHGYSFDLRTGKCAADPRVRLRQYELKREGDEIHVRAVGSRRSEVFPTPGAFEDERASLPQDK